MASLPRSMSRLLCRATSITTTTSAIPMRYAHTQASPPTSSTSTSFQQSPTLKPDDHISNHPLIESLRQDPSFKESRPHLAMPAHLRPSHFVAGSLSGQTKLSVAPYIFLSRSPVSPITPATEAENLLSADHRKRKGRVVAVFHIGSQMCGHPGFVHGGLLSVMFDEVFAHCVSQSFPSGTGMTANLNVDFRKPALPDRVYVLRAETVKVEGRKAWVEGSLTSLPGRADGEGEQQQQQQQQQQPVVVAEGRALFVEPRFAESMVPVYRN